MSLIEETFERALENIQTRVFSVQKAETRSRPRLPIAVAYSGGIDSTALLYLAKQYAEQHNQKLYAFHIHHGINPNADTWLTHCQETCEKLAVPFESANVVVDFKSSEGIEADARKKRYQALNALCQKHGVALLLTAHHRDDQAETLLMQLLRGTGLAGLSGMDACVGLSGTSGNEIHLGRPLLAISKGELESWCAVRQIPHIEDESNSDTKYTRNAIRHRIMPLLAEHFPGFEKRLSSTADHVRTAARLLDVLAEADYRQCAPDGQALDMDIVRALSSDRIDNLLQYWLAQHSVRIPSTAWFQEMRKQLLGESHDVQTELRMDGKIIRKYRNKVTMTEQTAERQPPESPIQFNWNGEPSIQFRTWYGKLIFEEAETGYDLDWLRNRIFTLRPYVGSAVLKVEGRPSKDLKALYQDAGISGNDRRFMPSIYFGEELIYAAGVGQSAQYIGKSGKCVRLRWETL